MMWDPGRSYQRVAIEGLTLPVRLGAYPEERAAAQPVRVAVELFRHQGAYGGGGLDECLNYNRIYRWLVATWPTQAHVDLLEELAEPLIAFCLDDQRVAAVRIQLAKVAVYGGQGYPVLEVYRRGADVAEHG